MLGSALGGFFGSRKINQNFYNTGVNGNLNWLGGQFKTDGGDVNAALNAFKTENSNRIADTNRLRGMAEADYNALFSTNKAYDPMAEYERLRTGNLGALKEWSGVMGDLGRRNDTMAKAAMGLGGRPDGSYERVLSADRVSRNLSPVVGQVMGNLGRDTSALGALRSGSLADSAGLIDARTNTANIGAGLSLAPAYAALNLRNAQTDLLGKQADVAKANTSGFTKKENWADRMAAGDQAFTNSVGQWVDMASKAAGALGSVYTGGAGGMMGGMGGMGGMGSLFGGMGGTVNGMPWLGGNQYGSYAMAPGGALAAFRTPYQQARFNQIAATYEE